MILSASSERLHRQLWECLSNHCSTDFQLSAFHREDISSILYLDAECGEGRFNCACTWLERIEQRDCTCRHLNHSICKL